MTEGTRWLFSAGDFTRDGRLCNDAGMVEGQYADLLNRMRRHSGLEPYYGAPFPCTGSAHLAGEHIRCTSPAHARHDVEQRVEQAVDALPERPERIAEPLPEDLERILRDPDIAIPQDVAVHEVMVRYARSHPDEPVSRNAYLNLWALYKQATS